MGASHMMSTSVQKTASFLARLHMAVEIACSEAGFSGDRLPINDGVFLISKSRTEIMTVVRSILALMALSFIATQRPQDRCLMRGAIAFGPVHFGRDLLPHVGSKKLRSTPGFLGHVAFGHLIARAYQTEGTSVPYGIAIHESARAFAPSGSAPFRMKHWLWWANHSEMAPPKNVPPLATLKDCLQEEFLAHFAWLRSSLVFHGISSDKIGVWEGIVSEYYSLG